VAQLADDGGRKPKHLHAEINAKVRYERSEPRPTGEAKAIHQLESECTTTADIHNAEEHIRNLITSSSAGVHEDHGSLHARQDLGSSLAPELVLYAPPLREDLQEEEYASHPNHVPHSPACSIQCMHAPHDECQLPHTRRRSGRQVHPLLTILCARTWVLYAARRIKGGQDNPLRKRDIHSCHACLLSPMHRITQPGFLPVRVDCLPSIQRPCGRI